METIIIVGRIVQEQPTTNTTQNGKMVSNFTVAINSKRNGVDMTSWYDCSYWHEADNKLLPYLTKGTVVCITGKPSLNLYLNKANEAAGSIKVSIANIELISSTKPKEIIPNGE